MRKGKKRLLTSLLAAALVMASCFGFSMSVNAYWDFGIVSLTLGRTEVTVTAGQTVNVSVTLKPASHDQLPGCGMEKCPSTCGEKSCYNNAYGQCGCGGATSDYLATYYPIATVSSGNPGVATATYDNGVLTIYGVSEGETELSVVGSLRQWTDSPAETISVTVEPGSGGSSGSGIPADQVNPDGSGNSGSSNNSGGSGNSVDSTNAIAAELVTGENAAGTSGTTSEEITNGTTGAADNTQAGAAAGTEAGTQAETAAGTEAGTAAGTEAGMQAGTEAESAAAANAETGEAAEDEITSLEVEEGTYWFVPITGLPQGKEQFEQIMGDERQYVDFQLKDDAENVIYAWEFWGKDVERAEDMVFTIESSQEEFEGCSYGSPDNSLYLTFSEEGEFVGKTSIFYRISDYFSNSDILYLYRWNPEDDSLQLVAEGLTISNGYVTLPLTEGGSFILTTEELMDAPEGMEEEIEQQPEETDVDAMAETEPEEDNTGLSVGAIVAIVIVVAAAIAAVIIFLAVRAVRKKKKGPGGDGTGEDESEFWVEAGEEGDGDASESPEESEGDAPESPEERVEEGPEEGTKEE